jgi:hypothetical protein
MALESRHPTVEGDMTIDAKGNSCDDQSPTGCKDRVVLCTGWAEASDPDRATAIRQAKNEAKRQKDAAVADAEQSIHCPSDGCDSGEVCRRSSDWYVGQNAGTVTDKLVRDAARVWHTRQRMYVEKRLDWRCGSAATAASTKRGGRADALPNDDSILF